jgi:predicted ArsR family transcriptional regulator
MPKKIDVQDVRDRLLHGETPSEIVDWYFEELGIDITRQAIALHRQDLVKEGKLERGKPGRPKGSYTKREPLRPKKSVSPNELIESLISIAKMADEAKHLEQENSLLKTHIARLEALLRDHQLPFQPWDVMQRWLVVQKTSSEEFVPGKE